MNQPGVGTAVHFKDSRPSCVVATVLATARMSIQTGETPEGKPIYEIRDGVEVEVVDNGGRYNRTVLHRDTAHVRSDSFHLPEECKA